jgi:hypothetical protein
MVHFGKVKALATALLQVEESPSYGTPAFKVRDKLMARLKEYAETLVVRVAWEQRERLLATYPEVFFLTDHYRSVPWVLLRLAEASTSQAKAALLHAWQQSAPISLQRSVGEGRGAQPFVQGDARR